MTMKYNFAQIADLRGDIALATASMNNSLGDLKQYLAPLVADWTGEAAEAYQVQQRKWDDSANNLNQVLDAIGRAVGAGNDNMAETERAARNQWAG